MSDERNAGVSADDLKKNATVALGDIANSTVALGRLGGQPVSLRLAHKILQLGEVVDKQMDVFHKERQTLLTRLGSPDAENANRYQLDPKNSKEFNEQMDKLLKRTALVPRDLLLTLGELNEAKISAADLKAIKCFVSENHQ